MRVELHAACKVSAIGRVFCVPTSVVVIVCRENWAVAIRRVLVTFV